MSARQAKVTSRIGQRYVTPEGPEVAFQPGSRGRVLLNRLGITKKSEMDQAEYEALLKAQERFLTRNTPCRSEVLGAVAWSIAEVHAELLLIHPFRDGNGRVARWMADLMALQAGFPAPKYEFEGRKSAARDQEYLAAVIRGYSQDYEPLASFFGAAIEARLSERR